MSNIANLLTSQPPPQSEGSFRKLPELIETLATDWSKKYVSDDQWVETGKAFGGEAGSFQVKNSDGLLAMAKPGRGRDDPHCRKALEKLACEIANLLDLPVPPVSLHELNKGTDAAHWVSLSAWAYQECYTLGNARSNGFFLPSDQAQLNLVANAAYVFDLFIGNTDRSDNNVVVGRLDNGDLGIALIDHSYSMTHGWQSDNHPWQHVHFFGTTKIKSIMKEIAERIAALSVQALRDILVALPEQVIDAAKRERILNNLTNRSRLIVDKIDQET